MHDEEMQKKLNPCYEQYYNIAPDTVYLDQLILFALKRKEQTTFPSFKLNNVSDIITRSDRYEK